MSAPACVATYAPVACVETGWASSPGHAAKADADAAVEAELFGLARSEGPLRRALAELCARFAECEGFARLGFASMDDWAAERLGRSGRTIYDHARVGVALRGLPGLRAALESGALGFAKLRLVARVATVESEERWIRFARAQSADALSRELRRIDAGALELGGLDRDVSVSRRLELNCTPEVIGLWGQACRAARQVSGIWLRQAECAEVIAAEVASALPIAAAEAPGTVHPADHTETPPPMAPSPWLSLRDAPECRARGWDTPAAASGVEISALCPLPAELPPLLRDLDAADAFELERRLRELWALEQHLGASIGPRLDHVLRHGVHRALGYRHREAYLRERLGIDPAFARMLLRIERAAQRSPGFAQAWREGALTPLQAGALVPLLHAELSEAQVAAWIARARGFALRRIRDDVEAAILLREQDHPSWLRTAGLPQEPVSKQETAEREIGANSSAADRASGAGLGADAEESDPQEIGATLSAVHERVREVCQLRVIVDSDVAQLFCAVLCSVRRSLERKTGHSVTKGEALGWICAHVLRAWGVLDATPRREHRVFERDGWRCAAPACSKMRSLHAHHVIYRAQGGPDAGENLITLCAYHHLRGVHGGTLRIHGRAPHALRFELGIRDGQPPLAIYASGDRRLAG